MCKIVRMDRCPTFFNEKKTTARTSLSKHSQVPELFPCEVSSLRGRSRWQKPHTLKQFRTLFQVYFTRPFVKINYLSYRITSNTKPLSVKHNKRQSDTRQDFISSTQYSLRGILRKSYKDPPDFQLRRVVSTVRIPA